MPAEGILRVLLYLTIIILAAVGVAYLWNRRLSSRQFCLWVLVALAAPLIGPILIIACRPGEGRRK